MLGRGGGENRAHHAMMVTRPHCPQGQVTRAQEAEENYIIKRELAVVKQRCTSATENLQRAQTTIRQLQDQQVGVPKCPQMSPDVPIAPTHPPFNSHPAAARIRVRVVGATAMGKGGTGVVARG